MFHENAEKVLPTPLLDSIKEDNLHWWSDAKGMFTVKSANK